MPQVQAADDRATQAYTYAEERGRKAAPQMGFLNSGPRGQGTRAVGRGSAFVL